MNESIEKRINCITEKATDAIWFGAETKEYVAFVIRDAIERAIAEADESPGNTK